MATSVFKRQEKKYLVEPWQRHDVEAAAHGRMAPDAYGRTLITSVYLDTPERSIIARSLEKPLYKEKLRLRVYGQVAGEALLLVCRKGLCAADAIYGKRLLAIPTFFELKKKFKGVVYKRRVRMSLPGAWAFSLGASFESAQTTFPLDGGMACAMQVQAATDPQRQAALDRQIAREIEAALARHDELVPTAAILCWRTAWAPSDEADEPRITFDDGLSFIDLAGNDETRQPVTSEGRAVMEIKATNALPSWLTDALSSTRCYPQSFSKYGEAARIMAASRQERNAVHA